MAENIEIAKKEERIIPTITELYKEETLMDIRKEKELILLLNCNPPSTWVKEHPSSNEKNRIYYIPIEKIEFLLTRIFNKWWVEIKEMQLIANSVVVTVRLYYINPITGKEEWQDGIGAQPLQTDKGAGATDFNAIKNNAVSLAAPSAESYAIKDAAEKLGKLFGKDLSRKSSMDYEAALIKEIGNINSRANKILNDEDRSI